MAPAGLATRAPAVPPIEVREARPTTGPGDLAIVGQGAPCTTALAVRCIEDRAGQPTMARVATATAAPVGRRTTDQVDLATVALEGPAIQVREAMAIDARLSVPTVTSDEPRGLQQPRCRVVCEQLGVADVAPHHDHRPVPGLTHDRALALAGLGC